MVNILLVGHGAMGKALRKGWENSPTSSLPLYQLRVIHPSANPRKDPKAHPHLQHYQEWAKAQLWEPDIIVVALKPQVMPHILPTYRALNKAKPLWISIAAGISLSSLKHSVGEDSFWVRAMPNLGVLLKQGVTALFKDHFLSSPYKEKAEKLFESLGIVCWLEEEKMMAPFTALFGSGPAYLFHFLEIFCQWGKNQGLSETTLLPLLIQTFKGSLDLLHLTEGTPTNWREKVTSPGGTTEAALNVLAQHNLPSLFHEALNAGYQRSKALGESFTPGEPHGTKPV